MTLEEAKKYLFKMENLSKEQKHANKRAVEDAKQLSAWVSIVEHGSDMFKKIALKQIKSI